MSARRVRRKSVPDLPSLSGLEAELHARQPVASLTAAATTALIEFVTERPGVTVKEAITEGCPRLSRRTAEDLVRTLLDSGELRSDRPGVPFHNRHQLYVADDGGPDSENRL